MTKLTFFDSGKLRWAWPGGKLLLSPRINEDGEEAPCCCSGCNERDLIGTKLYFSACHGCERAQFSVYVSEYYVKDINLNTSNNNGGCNGGSSRPSVEITQEILDNINIEEEEYQGQICCLIYVRLGCRFSDNSPPGPCHSDVAGCEAVDKRGKTVFDGIIGLATQKVYICPPEPDTTGGGSGSSAFTMKAAPYTVYFPEPAAWEEVHKMPLTYAGTGTILQRLLMAKFFPNCSDVSLTDDVKMFISLADANSPEWCEYQIGLFLRSMQAAADSFNMSFDLRVAHVFFKRAIQLAKRNRRKNG